MAHTVLELLQAQRLEDALSLLEVVMKANPSIPGNRKPQGMPIMPIGSKISTFSDVWIKAKQTATNEERARMKQAESWLISAHALPPKEETFPWQS